MATPVRLARRPDARRASLPQHPRACRAPHAGPRRTAPAADFDIRDNPPAAPRLPHRGTDVDGGGPLRRERVNRDSGSLRVLDRPEPGRQRARSSGRSSAAGSRPQPRSRAESARSRLPRLVRDYTTPRHRHPPPAVPAGGRRASCLRFRHRAFISHPNGRVLRVTSKPRRQKGGTPPRWSSSRCAAPRGSTLSGHARPPAARLAAGCGRAAPRLARRRARRRDDADVLVDAQNGELLFGAAGRATPARSAASSSRPTQRRPRRAAGRDAARCRNGCPPPSNHELRSLERAVPRSRDSRRQQRAARAGTTPTCSAAPDRQRRRWARFDGTAVELRLPVQLRGIGRDALFFALNFAHDFFYDLGLRRSRRQLPGQTTSAAAESAAIRVTGIARAAGRNNANYQPAPDGTSPTISMFLWDGTGCWSAGRGRRRRRRSRRRLRPRHRRARVPSRRQPAAEHGVHRQRGRRDGRRRRRLLRLQRQRQYDARRVRAPGRPAQRQRQELRRLVLACSGSSASRTTTARSGRTCCGTCASVSGSIAFAAAQASRRSTRSISSTSTR